MTQKNDAYLDALAERLELHAISLKVIGEAIEHLNQKLSLLERQLKERR